ncbi:ribose-phosphate pyrophosphokinase 1 [Neoconidiobolus thromboides FSU 785]|nr:ribose-phosphate pyrophosphokinase 1 [Neoconidiobolus thromboides FSU 785]
MRQVKIFGGSSHPELSELISQKLAHPLAPLTTKKFSNQESVVEIGTSVRNEDVFIIQSGSGKVNDNLMELLIAVSACKIASASRVTAVLPYFPYSKQSKSKNTRSCIAAQLVADMISVAGVDHVITMDLHASQMQGFFNVPVDNLYAEPAIAKWIRDSVPNYKDGVVVSKNAGGAKRVTSLADCLDIDFALIHNDPNHKAKNSREYYTHSEPLPEPKSPCESLAVVGDVAGKIVFLCDDIIDKCNNFIQASDQLINKHGAAKVFIIATHGVLSGDSLTKLEECSTIHKVVVTNTYPIPVERRKGVSKLEIIDISGTLAEAIRRTHNGESISFLFKNPL